MVVDSLHITVKVVAGAKRESLKEITSGRFEISVREEAERNLANKRVVALIAERFGVSEKLVRILKGHRGPAKLMEVIGSRSA